MNDSTNIPQLSQSEIAEILMRWTSAFMQHSMQDFLSYARSANLSMAQINVLIWLYYHGEIEVMGLEKVMQVSRPAASQMVERLVQQNLVIRKESPYDRRARLVQLSEYGRELVNNSISLRQKWLNELIDTFSDQEKQTIAYVFNLINQRANSLEADPLFKD
ncbi:MAG: MarR family transcriptional regulator [Anaerolineae bacterium]|nr:MarR family transcriptional regulator [Anaerolineae bacterium]